MSLTIDISKHPVTNKKRKVELQILILSHVTEDYEVRLLCTQYQTIANGTKIAGTEILHTPTTIGEYVDSVTGKKKAKTASGAISKKTYYESVKRSGTKSDLDKILDTFKDEVAELDNAKYFD